MKAIILSKGELKNFAGYSRLRYILIAVTQKIVEEREKIVKEKLEKSLCDEILPSIPEKDKQRIKNLIHEYVAGNIGKYDLIEELRKYGLSYEYEEIGEPFDYALAKVLEQIASEINKKMESYWIPRYWFVESNSTPEYSLQWNPDVRSYCGRWIPMGYGDVPEQFCFGTNLVEDACEIMMDIYNHLYNYYDTKEEYKDYYIIFAYWWEFGE
ncbi:MAG: hypothetical protein Q6363_004120 [Candidatus Njordarchaeota archaeon]